MTFDFAKMLDLLPVRPPMVLVDRVAAFEPGRRIEVEKAVSSGETCYLGLADGLPLERYAYPRSLIVESFGQAAALLWLGTLDTSGAGSDEMPMVGRLRGCVFHADAYPGDVIRHRIAIDRMVEGNAFMSGESRIGGRLVLTVDLLVAVARPSDVVIATR